MQTVLSTSVFLRQAKRAGLTEDDLKEIESTLAGDPTAGDVMPGTDLSQDEKNDLAKVLPTIADAYRQAARTKAREKKK